jgi:hypothetical protein
MNCHVLITDSIVGCRGLLTSGRDADTAGKDAYIVSGSSLPDEGDFDGQQRQDPTE